MKQLSSDLNQDPHLSDIPKSLRILLGDARAYTQALQFHAAVKHNFNAVLNDVLDHAANLDDGFKESGSSQNVWKAVMNPVVPLDGPYVTSVWAQKLPGNECPSSNNTEYTAPLTSSNFRITCGIDWKSGVPTGNGNGTVQDLVSIYSDSMEECIDACASYNHNQGGTPCTAVSYTANLTEPWVSRHDANCFLKNTVGVSTIVAAVACAKLVSS
jgi:hypothetical protein